MSNSESAATRQRIIDAGADLFSMLGYHGASTREIARLAVVSEVTIFRHFRTKRDLFLSVLNAELSKLKIGGEALSQLADASNFEAALAGLTDLVDRHLAGQPRLARLLQFSALEVEEDLQPVFRKHISELVNVVGSYLKPWAQSGELQQSDPRHVVFEMAVIALSSRTLESVFGGDAPTTSETLRAYANFLLSQPFKKPLCVQPSHC